MKYTIETLVPNIEQFITIEKLIMPKPTKIENKYSNKQQYKTQSSSNKNNKYHPTQNK